MAHFLHNNPTRQTGQIDEPQFSQRYSAVRSPQTSQVLADKSAFQLGENRNDSSRKNAMRITRSSTARASKDLATSLLLPRTMGNGPIIITAPPRDLAFPRKEGTANATKARKNPTSINRAPTRIIDWSARSDFLRVLHDF